MKWYGFSMGWVVGMILQLIIMPFIVPTFPNHAWWIYQLVGLFISVIVWLFLDRKVIIAYYKTIDWNAKYNSIIKWLHS
jgi:hypothetical protein